VTRAAADPVAAPARGGPVALSGGVTLSAEKHRGRKMVRVEELGDER